jgi:hypothetical protein
MPHGNPPQGFSQPGQATAQHGPKEHGSDKQITSQLLQQLSLPHQLSPTCQLAAQLASLLGLLRTAKQYSNYPLPSNHAAASLAASHKHTVQGLT